MTQTSNNKNDIHSRDDWKTFGDHCADGQHYGLYDQSFHSEILRHEARYYPQHRSSSRLRSEGECRGTVILMNPAGKPAQQLVVPWWTMREPGRVSRKVSFSLWNATRIYKKSTGSIWNTDDYFRILNLCDICNPNAKASIPGLWPSWGPKWIEGTFVWIAWGTGNPNWQVNARKIIDLVSPTCIWIDRTGLNEREFSANDTALFPLPQKQSDKDFIDKHLPNLEDSIAKLL